MTILIRFGAAAAAVVAFACAIPGMSRAADCITVSAAGDGLTESIASLMSTQGVRNILEHKGYKLTGEPKTRCDSGSLYVECTSTQQGCK